MTEQIECGLHISVKDLIFDGLNCSENIEE